VAEAEEARVRRLVYGGGLFLSICCLEIRETAPPPIRPGERGGAGFCVTGPRSQLHVLNNSYTHRVNWWLCGDRTQQRPKGPRRLGGGLVVDDVAVPAWAHGIGWHAWRALRVPTATKRDVCVLPEPLRYGNLRLECGVVVQFQNFKLEYHCQDLLNHYSNDGINVNPQNPYLLTFIHFFNHTISRIRFPNHEPRILKRGVSCKIGFLIMI
jgi:hypothetical protein